MRAIVSILVALTARGAAAQQALERLFYYVDTENSYTSLVTPRTATPAS